MGQANRIHAFDNLRAIMMWLGIVLHVALNHTTAPSPLPWRDSQTTPLADLILVFIHAFRMPVFFILAGFFVAYLVTHRGHWGMVKHRLRRLALPFVIFWPVLIVCTTILMLMYVHLMERGTVGLDVTLLARKSAGATPFNTMHMWFIYYLVWFCVLTGTLTPLWSRMSVALRGMIDEIFLNLVGRWWGLLLLTLPLALIGSFHRAGVLAVSGSFIPQPDEIVHHGMFFVVGLLVYRHREILLPRLVDACWRNALVGTVVFAVASTMFVSFAKSPGAIPYAEVWIAFLYNLTSWLWSFALIGLFLRYLSSQNRVLRYVSDSSYWVFLVHMLGTIGFGALVYKLPLGPFAKMALNMLATAAACLLTYQLLVRRTFIGVLLNGKQEGKISHVATPTVSSPT